VLAPGQHGEGNDEHAHAGGQVAVDHFHPGLAMGDRAGGHGGLGGGDLRVCAQRAGVAVAAGPVGQPRPESVSRVKAPNSTRSKVRNSVSTASACSGAGPRHAGCGARPTAGHQGDEGAEQHQLQHGCQIVECLLGHQCSLPDSYNCRWFRPAARNSPRPASGPGWPVRAGGVAEKVACTHHGVGPTGCVLGATPPRPHLLGRRWWHADTAKPHHHAARRHQKLRVV
jgi:hypothetical protein